MFAEWTSWYNDFKAMRKTWYFSCLNVDDHISGKGDCVVMSYVASVNQYFRKELMWVTDVSTESIETWEWNKEVPWSLDTSWLAVIILQSYSISLFPFSSILLMFVTSCQELWGLLMAKSVKFSWLKNFHSQKKSASTQLPYDRVRTIPGIAFLTRLNLYS